MKAMPKGGARSLSHVSPPNCPVAAFPLGAIRGAFRSHAGATRPVAMPAHPSGGEAISCVMVRKSGRMELSANDSSGGVSSAWQ